MLVDQLVWIGVEVGVLSLPYISTPFSTFYIELDGGWLQSLLLYVDQRRYLCPRTAQCLAHRTHHRRTQSQTLTLNPPPIDPASRQHDGDG